MWPKEDLIFKMSQNIYRAYVYFNPKKCSMRLLSKLLRFGRTDEGYTKIDRYRRHTNIFQKTFFRFMGYFQRYIKIHFVRLLYSYFLYTTVYSVCGKLKLTYTHTVLMSDSGQNKLNCNTKYRWTQPDKNYLSAMSERIIVYKTLYDFYLSKSFIYNIKQTYMCAKNYYFHYYFGVLYDINS